MDEYDRILAVLRFLSLPVELDCIPWVKARNTIAPIASTPSMVVARLQARKALIRGRRGTLLSTLSSRSTLVTLCKCGGKSLRDIREAAHEGDMGVKFTIILLRDGRAAGWQRRCAGRGRWALGSASLEDAAFAWLIGERRGVGHGVGDPRPSKWKFLEFSVEQRGLTGWHACSSFVTLTHYGGFAKRSAVKG